LLRLFSSALTLNLLKTKVQASHNGPVVIDSGLNVTYQGIERNGIEVFLNVRFAQDTSGPNRFKPPRPYIPKSGATIDCTREGPACPQAIGASLGPLTHQVVKEVSEDCLALNIARPKNVGTKNKLPVMVWIHGGSFWTGSINEPTTAPDGLILQSIKNGLPVIHVSVSYRLGVFGFAQSDALKAEGSENAGLRDQRAGIKWVKLNIAAFGGDPQNITIHGQSSGGLSIGLQLLAYGGSKPLPFQRAICESQALEPGITGNFTINAMRALVDHIGCNSSSLHSPETVTCLRNSDTQKVLNAAVATYSSDIAHNIGDIWLPAVDGDFLPAPPSQLAKEGKFAKADVMIGWTDSDVNIYTDFSIVTPQESFKFIQSYLPAMPPKVVKKFFSLYPSSEFTPPSGTNLTKEFYRAARMFRDVIMLCQPIFLGHYFNKYGNNVYYYDFNQTVLGPAIKYTTGVVGLGPVHTSEFAYVFGNLSNYKVDGYPFEPAKEDYQLVSRASNTWTTFATTGYPSMKGKGTIQGFEKAYRFKNNTAVYVIGGPHDGLSTFDGPHSSKAISAQRLRERCDFINSDYVIPYLQF
ncbi:hypothetical protein O181_064287, partial [Austropuccinia psidii MF-1]|nr:hypothetical protein [Austropuccinia psidii MF-1]